MACHIVYSKSHINMAKIPAINSSGFFFTFIILLIFSSAREVGNELFLVKVYLYIDLLNIFLPFSLVCSVSDYGTKSRWLYFNGKQLIYILIQTCITLKATVRKIEKCFSVLKRFLFLLYYILISENNFQTSYPDF